MEYTIGIILLISFFGVAYYIIRGGHLMMSMMVMAALWTCLAIAGKYFVVDAAFIEANKSTMGLTVPDILTRVFQAGPEGWGLVLVNVCFGAFFGRIMLDTGIVSTLIRKTVELGGDKPEITCALVCVVSALCFTTMTGPGAVIAIAIIVLPILLSLGIPRVVALWSYMLSVAAGFYLNPVIFAQYSAYFRDSAGKLSYTYQNNLNWAIAGMGANLTIAIIVASILIKRKRVTAWAVQIPETENTSAPEGPYNVPGIALLTPMVPVLLVIFLKLPIILCVLLGSLFALISCKKVKNFQEATHTITKGFHDGVIDSAPIIGFFLTVPMFIQAAALCAPYFKVMLAPVIPTSALFLCIAFAILSPLALFRGPLTIMGAGAVVVAILQSVGFTTTLLFPLIAATTLTMNAGACVTQSWIAWGIGYTKTPTNEYLKLSIPTAWLICAIMAGVTFFMVGR